MAGLRIASVRRVMGQPQPGGAFGIVLDRLRENGFAQRGVPRWGRVFAGPYSDVRELHVARNGQTVTAFIKILKPRADTPGELEATRRNIVREFETLTRVERAFSSTPGLSVPQPIACYPDLQALVTHRVDGEPLPRVLSKLGGVPSARTVDGVTDVVWRVGSWLKVFQTTEASRDPLSLERMRTYLDARLRPLGELGVCSPGLRERLLRYFDRRAQEIDSSDLPAVPVHADFTPENVIVAPGCVTVLDFTMAKQGARYLDLAHMFMQIEMLKARPWFRPTLIDRATTALLRGFDAALRVERPLFELLLLQNVVCFVVQTAQMRVSGLRARLAASRVRGRHLKWLEARAG